MLKAITDEEINEQIKNQYCSLNPSNNPVTIPLKSKHRIKWIPDRLNFSSFYGNPEQEEVNIAHALLAVLSDIPENCLEAVCRNIVLAGGFWRVKGMQKFFKNQIIDHIGSFPKLVNLDVKTMLGNK